MPDERAQRRKTDKARHPACRDQPYLRSLLTIPRRARSCQFPYVDLRGIGKLNRALEIPHSSRLDPLVNGLSRNVAERGNRSDTPSLPHRISNRVFLCHALIESNIKIVVNLPLTSIR